MRAAVLALPALLVCTAAPAAGGFAPTVCGADRATIYESSAHRGWVRRFWTGECQAGLGFCLPGPRWSDVIDDVSRRAAPAERALLVARACRLGERIGREWARPNDIRRISTADLRRLRALYERSESVADGLAALEKASADALGR